MMLKRVPLLLLTLVTALHGASAATAIEFQLLDTATTSPQPVHALPECSANAFNTKEGNLTSSEVILDTNSHTLIRGANRDNSASATAQQSLPVSLIGAPGATAQIRYVTRPGQAGHHLGECPRDHAPAAWPSPWRRWAR